MRAPTPPSPVTITIARTGKVFTEVAHAVQHASTRDYDVIQLGAGSYEVGVAIVVTRLVRLGETLTKEVRNSSVCLTVTISNLLPSQASVKPLLMFWVLY